MSNACSVEFERLIDFALGELEGEQASALQDHLDGGCSRCQKWLDWLRRVAAVVQASDSAKPTAPLVKQAVRLVSEPSPARASAAPLLSRILVSRVPARLVYDSRMAVTVGGIRGRTGLSKQLLYNADDLDIDLSIQAGDGDSFSIIGQVLPLHGMLDDVAGAEVRLVDAKANVMRATTDAFGQFTFGPLLPESYDLHIRVRDRDIEIGGMTV